ncbi:MAG: ATP-binding protein [Clostridia bacterium]|nr:ATP-binding protein [Clostridia bacterium]
MLLQFSVENFRSFKDKAILSMEASSDKELPENKVEASKHRVLREAVIFGANAAGKSNIFKALTAAILMVRHSNSIQVGEALPLMVPFLFDESSSQQPCSFEFVFLIGDRKYVYGFSATQKKIAKEYLYIYYSSRATVIFERTHEQYVFPSSETAKKLQPIIARNLENKLFLTTATAWNYEGTRDAVEWFMNGINTYSPDYQQMLNVSGPMLEKDTDGSLRAFTNGILQGADINIADYQIESEERPVSVLQSGVSVMSREYTITTLHKVENGNAYPLNLRDESSGTINLFFFAPVIKRAFETGETLCIDEFDASLHPLLVQKLVSLFNDPDMNRGNAQLIVSTHTAELMNLKQLRRDQIYFVEKENTTGCSTLYSLDEFSPRTREDIKKAYLLGRYGSVPNLETGYMAYE